MSPPLTHNGKRRRQPVATSDTHCRFYDTARWRRRRRQQLTNEPLCHMCLRAGKVVAATVADHIVPHRGDAHRFFYGDLASLCATHHSGAKQREEVRGYSDEVGDDGWPIDPRHPANQ